MILRLKIVFFLNFKCAMFFNLAFTEHKIAADKLQATK